MPSLQTPNLKAAGDIYPCRFVGMSDNATSDFHVEEAATADLVASLIGISAEGGRDARNDVNDTKVAVSGDVVEIHGMGETALLEMSAVCDRGNLIKSNNNTDGKGLPVDLSGGGAQYYGARALQACTNAGQKIMVQVMFGWITT